MTPIHQKVRKKKQKFVAREIDKRDAYMFEVLHVGNIVQFLESHGLLSAVKNDS